MKVGNFQNKDATTKVLASRRAVMIALVFNDLFLAIGGATPRAF